MKPQWKARFVTSSLVLAGVLGSSAFGQTPAPSTAPSSAVSLALPAGFPSPAATYRERQLPETQGTVQRFTLTPVGEIDGLILADGTEIHVPPHLTRQLESVIQIGDKVLVQGYRSLSVPLVVDGGEPPAGATPVVRDRSRHQLLARAGLTGDQHGGFAVSH